MKIKYICQLNRELIDYNTQNPDGTYCMAAVPDY